MTLFLFANNPGNQGESHPSMETMAASTEIRGCSSMETMVFSQFMEVTMWDQILDENKGEAPLADGAMFELTD